MSQISTTDRGRSQTDSLSTDAMLEVINNRRRRFTIHYLKQKDGHRATVSELAEQVASWENGKEVDGLSHRERKRTRNALRQFHLPKMDDYGFVEYDSGRGVVRLTDAARSTNFYIDSLTGGGIPWGLYYVVFSVINAIILFLLLMELYPFSLVTPLDYAIALVVALCISASGHFYDNYYRMRLSAQDKPPEVEEE